jgi:uncharacterized protein YjbI with pentapeptide repeats
MKEPLKIFMSLLFSLVSLGAMAAPESLAATSCPVLNQGQHYGGNYSKCRYSSPTPMPDGLDFTGANLTKSVLGNGHWWIRNANFSNANLAGATINMAIDANFSNANLTGATLNFVLGANLTGANLTGVKFKKYAAAITGEPLGLDSSYRIVDGVVLGRGMVVCKTNGVVNGGGMDFDNFDFTGAYFCGSNFEKADLQGANFTGAHFYCDFGPNDFSGANLTNANLSRLPKNGGQLILSNANLENANLQRSDFHAQSFSNANLVHANLTGSNIVGADFSNANLTGANLSKVITSWITAWFSWTGVNLTGATLDNVVSTRSPSSPFTPTNSIAFVKHK